MISIDQKDIKKQIKRITQDAIKEENELNRRTLNAVSDRGVKATTKGVNAVSGVQIGSIKRRIKVDKATKRRIEVDWTIRGRRLGKPGLRATKDGISYLEYPNKRKVLNYPMSGGSKPFVIKGSHSKKRVAVYVTAENKHLPWGKRPVKTLAGHSLAWYVERIYKGNQTFERGLKERMTRWIPEERAKQKKKLQFIKSRAK